MNAAPEHLLGVLVGLALGLIVTHRDGECGGHGRRSLVVTAIGAALLVPLFFVPTVQATPTFAYSMAEIGGVALGAGAVFLNAIQLAGALAGQGRAAPIGRAAPWIRGFMGAAAIAAMMYLPGYYITRSPPELVLMAISPLAVAAVLGTVAREGGESLLPAMMFAVVVARLLDDRSNLRTDFGPFMLQAVILGPVVVILAAQHFELRRRELERAGVTVFGQGDLALLVPAIVGLVVERTGIDGVVIALLATVVPVLGLRILARQVDRSAERAVLRAMDKAAAASRDDRPT